MSQVNFGIEPVGAVYFGDGRPTDAGETDFGRGRFPPTPRTIQGLVRTALLRSVSGLNLNSGTNRNRIRELVGPPEHLPAGWHIYGPLLAEWKEKKDGLYDVDPWLPIPRYLVQSIQGGLTSLKVLNAGDTKSDLTNPDDHPKICGAKNWTGNLNGYLSSSNLLRLLAGDYPDIDPAKLGNDGHPAFVRKETRTGLRITPGEETAEQGMLYTFNYYRLKEGFGFIASFDGDTDSVIDTNSLTSEITSLGGKNRLARLLKIQEWHPDYKKIRDGVYLPEEPEDGEQFWVFSVTPVQMSCPWKPGLEYRTAGDAHLKVITSVVGKREPIGGFSLAHGASAQSSHHLQAGSAWLIELKGGSAHDRRTLLNNIHNHCVLGSDLNENSFGFGHALVAKPLT